MVGHTSWCRYLYITASYIIFYIEQAVKSLFKNSRAIAPSRNSRGLLASSLALSICALGYWVQPAQAEGSRSLYPSTANANEFRANTEWSTKVYGPTGVTPNNSLLRRTLLKVYAKTGEYILLGSSAVGVNNADILVYKPGRVTGRVGAETIPGTADFSCNAQVASTRTANRGRITTRAMELAGPQSITGNNNNNGYIPCYYQAPQDGIYDVVMLGPSGNNSNQDGVPTAEIDLTSTTNFDASQNTSIAAWDVTVRSSTTTSTTDINGRLFTYYLSLFTGGNSRPINPSIYPVTTDGYRYRTDLNGLDPNGFLVYGNQQGFLNSDGKPLYHDVLGDGAQLTNLQGGTNFSLPTFPIFFTQADTTVLTALGIPISPIIPAVTNATFTGTNSANNSNYSSGGTFNFTSNVAGKYDLVISRDGSNFDPTAAQNRYITGTTASGSQPVSWDGKDNSGNYFPVGTNYKVQIVVYSGEYHFPLIDVEASSGGPKFTLLNATNSLGNTVGFYDDRGYTTTNGTTVGTPGTILCGSGAPTIAFANPITGFDTGTNQRAFGPANNTNTSCTGSFGDAKGLDIWTYFPSTFQTTNFNIVAPDLTITKTHTGNFIRGSTGTYTLAATNSGTAPTSGQVTVTDTLPTGLTPTAASGTGWSCPISGQTVTCSRNDVLNANSSYPAITLTVNVAANAASSITNTASVSGGGETNTTNDTANDPTTIISASPRLTLVKRITAINNNRTKNPNDNTPLNTFVDDPNSTADNDPNWPTPSTYLIGAINGGKVKPGDEVEYTIYFLDNQAPASNVSICDLVPTYETLVLTGYNTASPYPTESGAIPTDTGIALANDANTLPTLPTVYLTNVGDSDRGRYYPPNDPGTPSTCKDTQGNATASGAAANTNGAVVVDVVKGTGAANQLPFATAPGTPPNSYGFIRFKAKVN